MFDYTCTHAELHVHTRRTTRSQMLGKVEKHVRKRGITCAHMLKSRAYMLNNTCTHVE